MLTFLTYFFSKNRERIFVVCIASLLMLIVSFEFFYIHRLRSKYIPLATAQNKSCFFDGKTNLLTPWLGEDLIYSSKVNQIRIHAVPFDPYIDENRQPRSWIADCISFYFIALLSIPFSEVNTAWIAVSYAMTGLWFIFLYCLFKKIRETDDRSIAIYGLAALIPICFADVFRSINIDFSIPNIGKWQWLLFNFGFMKRGLEFLRISSPLVTFFFLYLWFAGLIFYLAKNIRSKKTEIFLGILAGLLIFVHFFEFTFGVVTLGILWILSMFRKELAGYQSALTWITGSASIASLATIAVVSMGSDPSVILRAGLIVSRKFYSASPFLLALGTLSIVYGFKRPCKTTQLFYCTMGASLAASFFLLNSAVVTGYEIQNYLYFRYANFSLSLIFAAGLLQLADRYLFLKKNAGWILSILLLITFFNIKSYSEKIYKVCALPKSWDMALNWTKNNVPADSKMLTLSPCILRLLATYSTVKQEVADGFPVTSKIPSEENLKRFATMLKTLKVQPDKILQERWINHSNASDQINILSQVQPQDIHKGWETTLNHVGLLPQETDKIRAYYATAVSLQEPFYLWVNPEDKPFFEQPIEARPDFKPIYKNDHVEIYYHPGSAQK